MLFQERIGGQIFASKYYRAGSNEDVTLSKQAVLIADFGLTTLRAIAAIPCGTYDRLFFFDSTLMCARF